MDGLVFYAKDRAFKVKAKIKAKTKKFGIKAKAKTED